MLKQRNANKESKENTKLTAAIFGLLVSCALFMNLNIPVVPEDNIVIIANRFWGALYTLLYGLYRAFENKSFLLTLSMVACFLLYQEYSKRRTTKEIPAFRILAFLLAGLYVCGLSFRNAGNLLLLYANSVQVVKGIVSVLGYTALYSTIIHIFYEVITSKRDITVKPDAMCVRTFTKHPFAAPWITILLALSIHVILKYPRAMTSDNWGQLTEFYGMFDMYAHWPPFHTFLLGSCVKIGEMIYSTNIGLFAYVILQWLLLSAVLAYSIYVMKQLNAKNWLIVLTLFTYCVAPFYTGYVAVTEKDVPYSIFVLLFVLQLIKLLSKGQDFWKKWYHVVLLVLAGCFSILFRNNGKYIVIPTLLLVGILILTKVRRDKLYCIAKLFVLILPVLLASVITNALISRYDIKPGSKAEAFSLPFQQTARYMKQYANEITPEEWDVLNVVFENADTLGELYSPLISDPVKKKYQRDTSMSELGAYIEVWFTQFRRHPLVYLEATLHQNYPLFSMDVDSFGYFRDFHMAGDDRIEFTEIAALQGP